jgi:hypothetical protein
MKKFISILILLILFSLLAAQDNDPVIIEKDYKNRKAKTLAEGKTMVGGYGEMIFTDPSGATPANMEFLRFILYVDHYFNNWIAFKSELEYEHGTELTLEQAFLELAVQKNVAIRSGLILVPTSKMNLYHEPTYFFPSSRPDLEKYITPTTWREFGAGVVGSFQNGISFEAYILAGMNSEKFSGANSIRKGRQGAGALENGEEEGGFQANLKEPAFTVRLDYVTPITGLQVGASLYYGGADNREDGQITNSKVSILSFDLDYQIQYARFIGTFAYNQVSNADKVNDANGLAADQGVGKTARGFNFLASYDLMPYISPESDQQLIPFVMYESYNKHASVPTGYVQNKAYDISRTIIGINYKPNYNVVFKADYTFRKTAEPGAPTLKYFQLGIGYNF